MSLEVAAAAEALAELLESQRRGLKHAKHARHVAPARRRIEKLMRSYFARQKQALLSAVKPHIAGALAMHPPTSRQESITASASDFRLNLRETSPGGRQFSRSLMPASLQPLRFATTAAEADEYDGAITDAITGAAATLGGAAAEAAAEDVASRYLRSNSLSKLTTQLTSETTKSLQDAIADAWDAGGSYSQIVDAITETFDDFSETRAARIAQTEVADAYNSGRDSIARAVGFDEKSWETESGDPCPTCIDNEDAGWLDIDDDFPSGDSQPTAHPNCLCVINFRRGAAEDEEDEAEE